MTRIIAAIFTLIITAFIVYLLFTTPWVVGVIIIGGCAIFVAWIVIVAIYERTLSFLENLEYTLRRRRALRRRACRQSEDKS